MADFECTCSVTKGEREIAWGDDCYCWYPKPNYEEKLIRCRNCAKQYQELPNGLKIPCPWSKSPDGFCAWAEPKGCEDEQG